MKLLALVLVAVCGTSMALTGGSGGPALTPGAVLSGYAGLRALPGLSVVSAPPFAGTPINQLHSAEQGQQLHQYFQTHRASYTVSMRVNGQHVRLFVTPGAEEGSATINTTMVYATTPHASAAQRKTLLRVAMGFAKTCWPESAWSLRDPSWQRLLTRPWQKDRGWQDRAVRALKVGWSGREGFYMLGKGEGERAGLTLTWPKGSGRCVF